MLSLYIKNRTDGSFIIKDDEKKYLASNQINIHFIWSLCKTDTPINIDVLKNITNDSIIEVNNKKRKNKRKSCFNNKFHCLLNINPNKKIGLNIYTNGNIQIIHAKNIDELDLILEKIFSILKQSNAIITHDNYINLREFIGLIYADFKLPYENFRPKLRKIANRNKNKILEKYNLCFDTNDFQIIDIPFTEESYGSIMIEKSCMKFKYGTVSGYLFNNGKIIYYCKNYQDIINVHKNITEFFKEYEISTVNI